MSISDQSLETQKAFLTGKFYELLECLRDGGGNQTGLGDSGTIFMSMTNATECYWGTSGRGNWKAKRRIETAGRFGFLTIVQQGRSQQVGISEKGYRLLKRKVKTNE